MARRVLPVVGYAGADLTVDDVDQGYLADEVVQHVHDDCLVE